MNDTLTQRELATLQVEVRHIAQNTERLATSIEKVLEKHEARISALENRVWRLVVMCVSGGAASGAAAASLAKSFGVL